MELEVFRIWFWPKATSHGQRSDLFCVLGNLLLHLLVLYHGRYDWIKICPVHTGDLWNSQCSWPSLGGGVGACGLLTRRPTHPQNKDDTQLYTAGKEAIKDGPWKRDRDWYTLNSLVSHLWQPTKVHVILRSSVVLTWMRDTSELV